MTRTPTNTERAFWDKIRALDAAGYETKIVNGALYFRRKATYTSDGGWTEARSASLVGIIPNRFI
jgi:peptide methionine sulfoxide reductase MsrB